MSSQSKCLPGGQENQQKNWRFRRIFVQNVFIEFTKVAGYKSKVNLFRI